MSGDLWNSSANDFQENPAKWDADTTLRFIQSIDKNDTKLQQYAKRSVTDYCLRGKHLRGMGHSRDFRPFGMKKGLVRKKVYDGFQEWLKRSHEPTQSAQGKQEMELPPKLYAISICSSCSENKELEFFSEGQLKKNADVRRCKRCTAKGTPCKDKNVARGTECMYVAISRLTKPGQLRTWSRDSTNPGEVQNWDARRLSYCMHVEYVRGTAQ